MPRQVIVIGSGFAGLSASAHLAKAGHRVTVIEQHRQLGGRARLYCDSGFSFDMGPSWYWMPEVFENHFAAFGKKPSDYYQLTRLDPSYRVFFAKDDVIDVPAGPEAVEQLFESIEPGSGLKLRSFLRDAERKYAAGMGKFVRKPSLSWTEFLEPTILFESTRLHLFKSYSSYVRKSFKHPKLLSLLEFPVLFLGATPERTPALYSLMNHADIAGGTWYPMGGMHQIAKAMAAVAADMGVEFKMGAPVQEIRHRAGKVSGVVVDGMELHADAVVSGADYHHTEKLLPPQMRNYGQKYWSGRTMAPSCLVYYLGIKRSVPGLLHHNLFFDAPFAEHATMIYDTHRWPERPLFYLCSPSKTDPAVAPSNMENIFVLVPVSTELEDNEDIRNRYYHVVMDRLTTHLGIDLRPEVVVNRSYARSNFIADYHSFKGNAYGLANTLRQTAFLKPKAVNKHLQGMFYTGQLTTPGPGVPPSIISGEVVAGLVNAHLTNSRIRS